MRGAGDWCDDIFVKAQWWYVRSKLLYGQATECGDEIDGIAMWLCKSPLGSYLAV